MAIFREPKESSSKDEKSSGCLPRVGCLGRVLFLLVLLTITFLLYSEPDLSRFEGRGGDPGMSTRASLAELEKRIYRGADPFELQERRINRYLSQLVEGRQAGIGAKVLTFEGAAIDFREGEFEVLLERTFLGFPVTQTSRYRLERDVDAQVLDCVGGSFGLLPVPGGFALLGRAAFAELARTLEPEIRILVVAETLEPRDGVLRVVPYR